MTRPTDDQMKVSLDDLTKAADTWRQMGDWLKQTGPHYGGHLADGLSFGLYVGVGLKYQEACLAMVKAAAAGGLKLHAVGDTLANVRQQYEQDEQNNIHEIQKKW